MSEYPGLTARIRGRLQDLGYVKKGRVDVRAFCAARHYRPQYVYGWLKGRVPNAANFRKLAADLGVSVPWLMFGVETEPVEAPRVHVLDVAAGEAASAGWGGRAQRRAQGWPSLFPDRPSVPPPGPQIIDFRRLREVTERLVELEADMEAIVGAFPDAYLWLDATGTVIGYRGGSGVRRDRDPEAVTGRPLREMFPADVAVLVMDALERARRTDALVSIEYALADGSQERTYEARLVPERSAGTERVLMVVRDITDRKKVETTLRALVEVGREQAETLDLDQAAGCIVRSVLRLLRVRRSAVWRLDPGSGALECVAADGEGEPRTWIGLALPDATGLSGRAVTERRPRWSADILEDPALDLTPTMRERIERDGYRAGLAFPLAVRERVLGSLTVTDVAGRCFTDDEIATLSAFADQAALTLENARLYTETEQRRAAAESLVELARVLTESLEPGEVSQRVADSVRRLFGSRAAGLYRLDAAAGTLVMTAVSGEAGPGFGPGITVEAGTGMVGLAVRERRPVRTLDIVHDPRVDLPDDVRARVEQGGFRAVLATPLVGRAGVMGTLSVADALGRAYTDWEMRLFEAFAAQAAVALDNAGLYAESRLRQRRSEALAGLARDIGSSLHLSTVLQRVTERARELCGGDLASIALRDPGAESASFRYRAGNWEGVGATERVEPGRGLGGIVLTTGRPVRTDDYGRDPRLDADYLEPIRRMGIVASLVVPIRDRERVEGLLYVSNRTRRPFTDEDEATLVELADQATIAIQNARLYAEAQRRRDAAEGLARVSRFLSQTLDPAEVAQRVADSVLKLLQVQISTVYRLDVASGGLVSIAFAGEPQRIASWNLRLPRGAGLSGLAILERRPVVSADVLNDPRIVLTPELTARIEQAPYRAGLALPLVVRDQAIGALALADFPGRCFDDEAIRLAETFAEQAALAFDNAALFEQSRRKLGDLEKRVRAAEGQGEFPRN